MPAFKKTNSIEPEAPNFKPVRVLEVEISQPIPAVPAIEAATGRHYQRALALVRLHTQPLGLVHLRLNDDGLSAEEHAREIWRNLAQEVIKHLRQDGLPEVTELKAGGLAQLDTPRCQRIRAGLLANAPFVSVVVATRDRPKILLSACLNSLLSLNYPNYEIIVVDNAPRTTATFDLIQQEYADFSPVRYVQEKRPGLVWARNRGLVEARGEIVAYTDDDVVVDEHWLAALVEGFDAAANVGCVTGLILPIELETPAQAWFEEFGGFSKGFTKHVFDMGENRVRAPLFPYDAGRFGSGNNMAFKTSVLASIGGFDTALCIAGAEDISAYFRLITRGYTLVYEPASIVYHTHRRDYCGLRQQMYWYGVGLAAYLTKLLVDNPQLLFDFILRVPYGMFYMLSSHSPKHRKKSANYPKELTYLERWGTFYGPIAYARGRWKARQLVKQFGPLEVCEMQSQTKRT